MTDHYFDEISQLQGSHRKSVRVYADMIKICGGVKEAMVLQYLINHLKSLKKKLHNPDMEEFYAEDEKLCDVLGCSFRTMYRIRNRLKDLVLIDVKTRPLLTGGSRIFYTINSQTIVMKLEQVIDDEN